MASEIRVNQIQNRSGLGTVTFTDTGAVLSGIVTVTGNLKGPSEVDATTVNATTVKVGTAVTISAGVVTATSFSGDGSNLTGIDATQIQTGNTSVQTVDTGSDGHVKITTEGTEKVRVGAAGSVGIGTDDPSCILDISDTGAINLPTGSTAERPSGTAGMIRFNSVTGQVEYWSSTDWTPKWRPITEVPVTTPEIDFLVVAAGGGGGSGYRGGAGGAGGYRTSVGTSGGGSSAESGVTISFGVAYSIEVGAGGVGGAYGGSPTYQMGANGGNSTFATITSTGGGGGGGYPPGGQGTGNPGGSGGGGGHPGNAGGTGTSGQGYAGGTTVGAPAPASGGGGGGGAGAAGADSGTSVGSGAGGTGLASPMVPTTLSSTYTVGEISGGSVYFAGGGGGSGYNAYAGGVPGNTAGGLGGGGDGVVSNSNSAVREAGAVNTGGGGAGGNYENPGANGGSGVIVLRTEPSVNATFTSGVTANGATGASIVANTSVPGYKTYIVTIAASGQTVTFTQV